MYPNTAELLLILNSIILGVRHGIDWDHLAALMDIANSTTIANDPASNFDAYRKRTLLLALLYGLGHCSIVILFGILINIFAGLIPSWLSHVTEKLVGLTLLIFGLYIAFITWKSMEEGSQPQIISRGALLLGGLQKGFHFVFANDVPSSDELVSNNLYGKRTAFGLGVIHGAGVETATQVFLLAAVGASTKVFGFCLLFNFSMGFLLSVLLIAYLGVRGIGLLSNIKPLYMVSSILTAGFSIIIGCLFISGHPSVLPELTPPISIK